MIGIIDYGSGNVKSILNVLEELSADYVLTNKIEELDKCQKILLPGVGEASYAMKKLNEYKLIEYLKNLKIPMLGICLGLQLLTKSSEEGETECLSIINETTIKFKNDNLIIPHMGWNEINMIKKCKLTEGIENNKDFYFANSYYCPLNNFTVAYSNYGVNFSAIVNRDNYWGIQFHPEKSGKQGIKIMENFIRL
jgi:glutamine amidotransferase